MGGDIDLAAAQNGMHPLLNLAATSRWEVVRRLAGNERTRKIAFLTKALAGSPRNLWPEHKFLNTHVAAAFRMSAER